jgi:hypothetical protein
LHFRQCLTSKFALRQFSDSKTRIVDKVGTQNRWVLIELAATNWFQRRQGIGSSHNDDDDMYVNLPLRQLIGFHFREKYKGVLITFCITNLNQEFPLRRSSNSFVGYLITANDGSGTDR